MLCDVAVVGSANARRITPTAVRQAYETKREQTKVGLATSRASGRAGGRPEVTADHPKVLKVKKLDKDGKLSVGDICKRLKISRSTYYRYVEM